MIETIYLHIGPHKTGSTTLQQLLGANRALLLSRGYLFPCFTAEGQEIFNHSIPFMSQFKPHPEQYFFNRNLGFNTAEKIEALHKSYDAQFRQQIDHFQGNQLIISGEGICIFTQEELVALQNYLKDCTHPKVKIEIIFFVRNPITLFKSKINHKVRNTNSLNPVLLSESMSIGEGYKPNPYRALVDTFSAVFTREQMMAIRFEEAIKHRSGPVGAFLQKIGVEESLVEQFTNEKFNLASSHEAILILSAINEHFSEMSKLDFSYYSALRKQIIDLPGQKFTIPISLQQALWEKEQQDMDWVCKNFSIPPYPYREEATIPESTRWSEETLDHLHQMIYRFPDLIKNIILGVLWSELEAHYKAYSTAQRLRLYGFIKHHATQVSKDSHFGPSQSFQGRLGLSRRITLKIQSQWNHVLGQYRRNAPYISVNPFQFQQLIVQERDIAQRQKTKEGLCYTATGSDPWFVFKNPKPEQPIKAVEINYSAPLNTLGQIFYSDQGPYDFEEPKSLSSCIFEGKNYTIFHLPTAQKATFLRFDPGMHPGKYTLERIKIRYQTTTQKT